MKEFKGTKGNLVCVDEGMEGVQVQDKNGYCIAVLVGNVDRMPNGKLFAAAPELLEALQDIIRGAKQRSSLNYELSPKDLDIIKQAINKAL